MRSIIAVVALVSLAVFATGIYYNSPDYERDLYDILRPNVFKILDPKNPRRGGTGFALKDESGKVYIVTNRHVCDLADNGQILVDQLGEARLQRVIGTTEKTDLCLIRSRKGPPGLEMADSARLYDRVYILGHPYLNPYSFSTGYISDISWAKISYCASGMAQLYHPLEDGPGFLGITPECVKDVYAFSTDAATDPGNSGSPAVNSSGQVMGVVFAGGPRIGLIVPLNDLKEFLEE